MSPAGVTASQPAGSRRQAPSSCSTSGSRAVQRNRTGTRSPPIHSASVRVAPMAASASARAASDGPAAPGLPSASSRADPRASSSRPASSSSCHSSACSSSPPTMASTAGHASSGASIPSSSVAPAGCRQDGAQPSAPLRALLEGVELTAHGARLLGQLRRAAARRIGRRLGLDDRGQGGLVGSAPGCRRLSGGGGRRAQRRQ